MKTNLFPAIKLTIVTLLFFGVVYPTIVWAIAQLAPNKGQGEVISADGKRYYVNIGQAFTEDRFFNSRPSAVSYNAAGSGGSNKAPSNKEYLAVVKARIDTFLVHNPGIDRKDIPVELVTASGSGLDPDISRKAALIQVKRIAALRTVNEDKIRQIVESHTEKPLLGMFGPGKVNVLSLNLALGKL
ncbi:K(+)-transporting ATPase subunit C [Dyadobacter chenwenxiniae]|uniref:Potassium-transporting ATPase KdpC subunit n=1 Tax=Dyadobacter chenwenxiniae TaxID=2906456 RepID=A0A9X1PUC7_9BACT|nr:K(+)-transporting ATPase subunit C [Dyadobacter chenwenxiniae]MCF0065286.1 K(+)-transporting ATPase subunit C [Dyadobacter chenwenxiniae]UON84446.1 K(+)-transporting ATPase subunit C [Dyadobacter chenwenxiniae]